ncbi:MAG: hypothetical protein HY985_04100 [Magnetospirillum sp.]|nr:hypothetical protein [Magnetospirillum sp.]
MRSRWLVGLALLVPWTAADADPLPPLESLSATLDRPLFSRGRRPPAGIHQARKVEALPASAPHLSVAGIAVAAGGRVALIQVEGVKDLLSVQPGGEVAGWTVADIQPGRIRLERAGEAFEAELREVKRR